MRATYFATGLSVSSDHRKYWLDIPTPPPMEEFAQRQVDLLELLRSQTDEVEREVYGLAQPNGVAIARRDKSEYRLEVRGSARVYPMDFDQIEEILGQDSLISARMELALNLPPNVTTKHLTTQRWLEERTQDPVVELLGNLRMRAEQFNARQPRSPVHLEKRRLQEQLTAAHVRDQDVARRMSETITIGGERGLRPSRALRLAIHTHGPSTRPGHRAAVCACPPALQKMSNSSTCQTNRPKARRRYTEPHLAQKPIPQTYTPACFLQCSLHFSDSQTTRSRSPDEYTSPAPATSGQNENCLVHLRCWASEASNPMQA
jgi:hypothetical protein